MTGRIHSFQSLGTVDGPGVRFVAFLMGCPLRCGYCHNPDTWAFSGGTAYTPQEVMARVRRCQDYFGPEGGVTLSGGEALCQPAFVHELFTLCHEEGIHTCLDTSGCMWNREVEQALSVTDLVLLDIKMTREEDYRRYTGGSLSDPMAFLARLQEREIPAWIRQVIIRDVNDDVDGILRLNELIAPYSCVKKVELLPFHKLCLEKYQALGIPFPFGDREPPEPARLQELRGLICLPK